MNAAFFPARPGFPLVPRPITSGARALRMLLFYLLSGGMAIVASAAVDPADSLKSFSDFRSLDPARLLDGEIVGKRGALMAFSQGIRAETCFAVPVPPEEAAHRLQVWDPLCRQAPHVLAFSQVSTPCEAADFENLSLKPGHHAMRWLLEKSAATTARRSELNLTYDEASRLGISAKANPDPQNLSAVWAKLLLERARTFQRQGFAGLLPYEVGGKAVAPAELLRTLLRENVEMAREFTPLLQQAGVVGNDPTSRLTPFLYWGLCEANRRGTLNLGAVYWLPHKDSHLLLDVQYYVSGTYYIYATLYKVGPIQAGARTGALVWRGDFFAAPGLAYTKGTERLAYGAIMVQDLKKAVRCFQDNVTAKP
ncbi:MAG: hypothetical protein AB9869_07255 [Verrucomicrobiia bacterium]